MNWLQKIALPTYYHGTDSETFDEFDPSKAQKGEVHYNPLGQGMYVTNKPEFAKMFGKNVYEVDVPSDCKIKRLDPKQAQSAIGDIIKRAMKKVGIDYWKNTDMRFKVELSQMLDQAEHSPYDAIMDATFIVTNKIEEDEGWMFGESDQSEYPNDRVNEFHEWVGRIATKKFSKFDVVVFKGTHDPNDIFIGECPTKEIIILNPAFQKVFRGELK